MVPWIALQLSDSGFPAGAFAHSLGLEAAWQQGEVDAGSLADFVRDAVAQTGRGALPFVTAAHADPEDLEQIDLRCEAFLRNAVANRASRVLGRAWLSAVERAWPASGIQRLADLARRSSLARHHAPIFGATLGLLDVSGEDTARLYLFGAARSVLSAGVRLGIVGTNDAQRLLADLTPELDRTLDRSAALTIDEASQTAPLIDIWQSGHDRLYSRLFQS